ncbi:hypothetical protein Tco_0343253 [Tanacetum coccineum]
MESNDGAIPCESNLFQEILLKMNLPDHRIKQRWRWRHLVPVESIHHPMLTLNASNPQDVLQLHYLTTTPVVNASPKDNPLSYRYKRALSE